MSIPDGTQATHSAECWKWHVECAGREVERLRFEGEGMVALQKEQLGEIRRLRAENERLRALLDRDRLVMVMRDGVEDLVDQIIDMHNVPPLGDDGE